MFPLPSRGRVREGVESSKILPVLKFTPHSNPLLARERGIIYQVAYNLLLIE
jgi:hypothetical protein